MTKATDRREGAFGVYGSRGLGFTIMVKKCGSRQAWRLEQLRTHSGSRNQRTNWGDRGSDTSKSVPEWCASSSKATPWKPPQATIAPGDQVVKQQRECGGQLIQAITASLLPLDLLLPVFPRHLRQMCLRLHQLFPQLNVFSLRLLFYIYLCFSLRNLIFTALGIHPSALWVLGKCCSKPSPTEWLLDLSIT